MRQTCSETSFDVDQPQQNKETKRKTKRVPKNHHATEKAARFFVRLALEQPYALFCPNENRANGSSRQSEHVFV